MDAQELDTRPARGRATGPIVWDRARWYSLPEDQQAHAESVRHIGVMLRWLWAHGLTTSEGDLAAQGDFTGALGSEPALTSAMVVERGAVFLDHYYGRWLSSLAGIGDTAPDDESIDALWDDFMRHQADLDRVWAF
jgi:hypothetical protein